MPAISTSLADHQKSTKSKQVGPREETKTIQRSNKQKKNKVFHQLKGPSQPHAPAPEKIGNEAYTPLPFVIALREDL